MDSRHEEPRHPIGVAAERTGLSTDVIRAWERRYGATEPARDASGQRVYSDADVERLRLLRRATEGGRAISRVATLPLEELEELVGGDEEARAERSSGGPGGDTEPRLDPVVDALESQALGLEAEHLERELSALLLELGFVRFIEEVARPLLRRLGEGWHGGRVTPAQEHVATGAVRRVLETARDLPSPPEDAPRAVVGTLAGERHETGALSVAAVVRLAGWRVIYLGGDLPVSELREAAVSTGARAVCISATFGSGDGELATNLRGLRLSLPDEVEVYAGGGAVRAVREDLERYGVRCPADLTALRNVLRERAR